MNQTAEQPREIGWAILELMGHRRLGGYLREETIAGAAFLRIDVPRGCGGVSDRWCPVCGDCVCPDGGDLNDPKCPLHAETSPHGDPVATQYYAAQAVYCVTPTTEAMAQAVAASNRPQPVQRWELPEASRDRPGRDSRDEDDDRDDMPY